MELQPGMVVRIEGAYYREGSPRTSRADYLGAETARYEVTPRGRLRLVALSSLPTQPRDQPAIETLIRPRNLSSRYHRLSFQIVMSRTGAIRPAMLLGARSMPALDKPCTPDICTAFPPLCTASLEINITVNGVPRMVIWGTTIEGVARNAHKVTLPRLPIPIDVSDPAAMRTPLIHGDKLTWE